MRAKPGELNWAGVTGANGFMFEAWLKANKLDMKKVPYRNAVEAARDLAENRVQVYESAVAIAQPQIEARQDQAARGAQHACGRRPIPTFRRWRRPAIRR